MRQLGFIFSFILALSLSSLLLLAFWIYQIDKKWSPLIEPRIKERQEIGSVRILAHDPQSGEEKWMASLSSGRLEERLPVALSAVPPILIQSIVLLEDPRFLSHEGFDIWGIMRAALAVMRNLRFSQGGSTITQQLVKNIFLTHEKTLRRKFIEIILAALVEKRFSKDEILEAYLNEIYLGQVGPMEVHGVGRAASYYFGKKLNQLKIHEMALLAAVIASPGYYSPWRHPERAKSRRERVLNTLLSNNMILESEFKSANNAPLPEQSPPSKRSRASYLLDALKEELISQRGEAAVLRGGFEVTLSLDSTLQSLGERLLLDFQEKNPGVQGLIVAANPQNCQIQTYIGGTDYRRTQLDRIRQSKRSIGSLIKPLLFSRLLDDPDDPLHLATVIEDRPLEWNFDEGRGSWSPENYDQKFRGKVTLRQTLEESLNVPTARIFFEREPNGLLGDYFEGVRAFGLEVPPDRALPSSTLGTIEQRPIEVLEAFVKLSRQAMGLSMDAGDFSCRLRLEKQEEAQERPESVEDAYGHVGARLSIEALQGALRRGTSRWLGNLLPANQAWAGKTGTSGEKKDAWYVAMSPELVILAWVGKDDNTQTEFTGASGALPLAIPLVKEVSRRYNLDTGFSWPTSNALEWNILHKEKLCQVSQNRAQNFIQLHPDPHNDKGLPTQAVYKDESYGYELFWREKTAPACP